MCTCAHENENIDSRKILKNGQSKHNGTLDNRNIDTWTYMKSRSTQNSHLLLYNLLSITNIHLLVFIKKKYHDTEN